MNQHKAIGILAVSAVLAAGLFSTAKPAAASGLTHALQIGQKTVIADHNDWNNQGSFRRDERRQEQFRQEQFRRQQELRRIEERRREEGQRNRGDRHFDNRNGQNNYNRDFNQNNYNR